MYVKLHNNDISPDIVKLRWRDFVGPAGVAHVGRFNSSLASTKRLHMHRHDFAEVFWVEHGRGIHLINGRQVRLARHQMVIIRPHDCHCFACDSDQPLVVVNVAFREERLTSLLQQYESSMPDWWEVNELPLMVDIQPEQSGLLSQLADTVTRQLDEPLALSALLMCVLNFASHHQRDRVLPRWLSQAMRQLDDDNDELADQNVEQFAELCGRSREHVNRVMKSTLGVTTTQWLTMRKLEHAAQLLRLTDEAIIDVAMDSGFENLGYFYRCFQRQFHQTPRQYRAWTRATVQVGS